MVSGHDRLAADAGETSSKAEPATASVRQNFMFTPQLNGDEIQHEAGKI
jgi:hypothetical protein